MDLLHTMIAELYRQRDKLDRVIASIETLEKLPTTSPAQGSRRGRKFMDSAERQVVSERMKRYWQKRRKIKARVEEIAK